jgi:hypothetical protein
MAELSRHWRESWAERQRAHCPREVSVGIAKGLHTDRGVLIKLAEMSPACVEQELRFPCERVSERSVARGNLGRECHERAGAHLWRCGSTRSMMGDRSPMDAAAKGF